MDPRCATHKDPVGGTFLQNAPPLSLSLCNYPLPCFKVTIHPSPSRHTPSPHRSPSTPPRRARPEPPPRAPSTPPLDAGALAPRRHRGGAHRSRHPEPSISIHPVLPRRRRSSRTRHRSRRPRTLAAGPAQVIPCSPSPPPISDA